MDILQGVIQAYAWGDPLALSALLGHEPPGHPEAEYWLGAHPLAPSQLTKAGGGLDDVIESAAHDHLGPTVAAEFGGEFPFLLKVLAAARPLSIQAHPSRDQAVAGFAREEAAGIDRAAPHRSYRDPNHKPELICAVTTFHGKCGFRPIDRTVALIARLAAVEPRDVVADLLARLDGRGDDRPVEGGSTGGESVEATRLRSAVDWLLHLDADRAAELVAAVVAAAARLVDEADDTVFASVARPGAETEELWAAVRWTATINDEFPGDIGVVVALLLNHVTLEPGEAIFLPAGNLHAYLSGVGVEALANSDNVLRGGLTAKNIDIDELLAIVSFESSEPTCQRPAAPVHRYDVPIREFLLERIVFDVAGTVAVEVAGPEILLVTEGEVTIETAADAVVVGRGGAGYVAWRDGDYTLAGDHPGTVVWRAAAPGLGPAAIVANGG